jgi:hypothetical protein
MRIRLLAAVALLVLVAAPVAQGTTTSATRPYADPLLRLPAAFSPPGYTGGDYTTASTGETVHVWSTVPYSDDPTFNQTWADFLGTLPHGKEISSVTVYLAPLAAVQTVCGANTLGCYSPEDEVLFATADDVPGQPPAKGILAHEYGHHLANSENDAPWPAEDYGTKRWSTYVGVCAGARDGSLFPGDEGDHYRLNPAEDFAENYRVLAERTLGLPESPWGVVDNSLYPDSTALQLLQQDIQTPWVGPTVSDRPGSFRSYTGNVRTFAIQTPLDGTLGLKLTVPAGSSYDLRVSDATGKLIVQTKPITRSVRTLSVPICGQRSFSVQAVRTKGFGAFTLQVSKP